MGSKKPFYYQEYRQHVGAVIMLIATFVAFILTTCGTPLGMLMIRSWNATPVPGEEAEVNPCYTLWGKHNNCAKPTYSMRITDPPISTCDDIRIRFEAAEAFSVLAIFSLIGVLGAAWYKICGSDIKLTVILLSAFSIGCTTVPWAVVTAFYYTSFCGLEFLTHKETSLGAGYVLLIISFVVQIISLILFVFLEPDTSKKKSEVAGKAASPDACSSAGSAAH
ncbi:hypothetical protein LSCM1_03710 [Leishmania martiniquensis]|uniref:Amastin-like surface protein-like protein n=1 Tax=Leishmania martiniquensis TaxID=1580590 RepID=A0A836KFP3_9TRYP|nr:hypothetical protein LSCM1_03710 [Leishmania martiniquensis]